MARIHFFTRTITKDKNALVPIYIRVKSGRKIDLCCKADILIKPDNWSNETEQARQRADIFKFMSGESKSELKGRQKFNDKITELRTFVESELMQAHQADINSEWLKTIIDKHWNPDKYKITLFSFIRSFIDKAIAKPVSYRVGRGYEGTFDYLKKYAAKTGKVIDFKDIDLTFYDGFTQYLQGENLALNTIGKKIQILKMFLNAAKEEGKNNYEGYKSKKFVATTEESETIYLNEAELTKLYEKDFSRNPALEHIRDLFLVGCWTGCRFSDIAQITPNNISGNFIHLKQHKTGARVIIPLHPVVTAILNKYEGRLPQLVTNQVFNRELKVICRMAELDGPTHKAITKGGIKVSTAYKKHELVSSHTARRSFSTNLYKSGFPSLSIMAITGHKTERAFLKYIKVTPDEHAKKLQVHWDNKHLKVV